MKTTKTDILILGGGLGGYEAYRSLVTQLRRAGIQKKITLVDKNEYFTFIPLLHEVATGTIGPEHTNISLPELFSRTPHTFIQASVHHIDPEKKIVTTEKQTISYDYCIIALGSTVNYFGTEGAEQHTLAIRTHEDAIALQKKLSDTFEKSLTEPVTINVIGGGFTGVEIIGQIHDTAKEYKKINTSAKTIRIQLVEGKNHILGPLPTKVQRVITKKLTSWGIHFQMGALVARVNATSIILEDGTVVPSTLSIWSGGVKNIAEPLLPAGYTERGRVLTTQYLTHPKQETLYSIGDIALVKNKIGEPIPQLGEVAHKQGMYVAKHIVSSMKGKEIAPFVFSPKGSLIPVGSQFGAAVIGPFIFFGALAWYLRRIVYLMFVPGWKNRCQILLDWALRRTS